MAALPWDPDHPTTPEIAAAAIRACFPEFADRLSGLALLGSGWDNDVWALPEEPEAGGSAGPGRIAFRFPRRGLAVELLELEARALPILAPLLPLPIPIPAWIGGPSAGWPLPFYGYRLLPGVTADRARLSAAERRAALPGLIGLLRALHAIPPGVTGRAGVPLDTFRSDPGQRISRTLARQDLLPADLDPDLRRAALGALTASPPPPPADPSRWRCCHGDLYARHVLVPDRAQRSRTAGAPGASDVSGVTGGVTGVIDWGDLCTADPAIDLAILRGVCHVPALELEAALIEAGYPAAPEEVPGLVARAGLHALVYGLRLVSYAAGIGDGDLRAEAEGALRHLTGA